ncbi:hypothetical protein AX16_002158 [Volvariella volvacea WC 439]|nr:hypothetical protein AX16_002158 [Volvariella volvacea WC 439]
MPAERTRGSRRTEADGNQLVWTMPVEPTDPSGISFATAVTPSTFTAANDSSVFDDMPPLVDAPPLAPTSEFILFPPAEEASKSSSQRRTTHTKKKPENHIPRPPNAFILFRSSFIKSQHVSTEVETNHSTLSKIIGLTWQSLPEKERQVWHEKAKAALEEHKRKYPKYAFRPLQNRSVRGVGAGGGGGGTGEKRKVREVEPKDLKRCAKIAELLVSGKKGEELNAAIQEFDKHHVPEIVTRFEAPITARQYRRSSSVPIPDSKETGKQRFLVESEKSKKRRAVSSRPTRCSTPASDAAIPVVASIKTAPNSPILSYSQPARHASSEDFASSIDLPAPLFDFSSFSFENAATPTPLTAYSPCDLPSPLDATVATPPMNQLQLNTSPYLMSTWSPPSSNATPEPCSPGLSTPGLDSSDFGFVYPLPSANAMGINQISAGVYQQPQQCGVSMGSPMDGMGLTMGGGMNMGLSGYDVAIGNAYLSHGGSVFVAGEYNQHQPIPAPVPQQPLDANFSMYMESLPQYAI